MGKWLATGEPFVKLQAVTTSATPKRHHSLLGQAFSATRRKKTGSPVFQGAEIIEDFGGRAIPGSGKGRASTRESVSVAAQFGAESSAAKRPNYWKARRVYHRGGYNARAGRPKERRPNPSVPCPMPAVSAP